jgi:hypothetical protein
MSRDFNKAKVYKITNDYNDDVYVGSTCDTLGKRYSKHKSDMKKEKYKHYKLYKLMNKIGFERFRIQLIIDYPCEDVYQLTQKEGEFIRQMGTLNKQITGSKKKEYYESNKNKIKEVHKEYYESNKNKIKEVQKEYYESNKNKILENTQCECGREAAKCHLNRHMKSQKHIKQMEQLNNTSNNEIVV